MLQFACTSQATGYSSGARTCRTNLKPTAQLKTALECLRKDYSGKMTT